MTYTNEEKNLLEKLELGALDGVVGSIGTTSGGSLFWMEISNGVPVKYKEGPTTKFFDGKENEKIKGVLHKLKEWPTDSEKLEFLARYGFLMRDIDVRAYSAKFKP